MSALSSAELTEQAQAALSALMRHVGIVVEKPADQIIAHLMWLDGYKAGMDATKALAEDAIMKALS